MLVTRRLHQKLNLPFKIKLYSQRSYFVLQSFCPQIIEFNLISLHKSRAIKSTWWQTLFLVLRCSETKCIFAAPSEVSTLLRGFVMMQEKLTASPAEALNSLEASTETSPPRNTCFCFSLVQKNAATGRAKIRDSVQRDLNTF